VPIVKKEADREAVSAAVAGLEGALKAAGVRVRVDAGTEKTPGWKFNFWEMKVRRSPAWSRLTLIVMCGSSYVRSAGELSTMCSASHPQTELLASSCCQARYSPL